MTPKQLLSSIALVCLVLWTQALYAQTKTITGKVSDSKDGAPISGATVQPKGTKKGVTTGNDGTFRISVDGGVTALVISSVGYANLEVDISGKTEVSVSLVATNTSLNEVVVVGYGTAKKKDLTGAVSSVSAKDFNKGVFTSPDQLLQGKVSGVQIINNTGQPGGTTTVKIRGSSAVTGSGQPLYVVDGVPLDGRTARPGLGEVGLGGSNPGSNPLNFINPSDISSIDILKDASATAIYGSRAAYGVVLITTKRGQSGQAKIDFSTSVGFSKIAKKIEVLDASQFRKALTYYGLSNANDKGSSVDALDVILRTGVVQNYNMAISGGNENARYRIALGVLNQEGIVKKSGIKKYTANFTGNFKFLEKKNAGIDINIIPSETIEDIAPISNNAGSRGSLIGNALQWNPTEKLILKGSRGQDSLNVLRGGDLFNPLAVSEAFDDRAKVTTILASISPYYKFTNWLEYRFLYSINYSTGNRRTTIQPFLNLNDVLDKGRALIANVELSSQQYTHTLNFNRKIANNINLNAVVGYEYQKFTNRGFNLNAYGRVSSGGFGQYGLDFTDYIQFSEPTNRGIGSYNDPSYELQSYFARTVFNYADKYLLTATIRRDGSSKFGTNNRYGYFPSVSAAWNISKENFFHVEFINSLKLRAGWGKTGNQDFPSGSAQEKYSFDGNGSLIKNTNENRDLKWQADRQYNVGADIAVLKNKVTITVDYFNKRTTGLLFPTEPIQPAPPGGAITWKNIDGKIDNKGIEAAVNASIIDRKDLSWDFGVNATFIKNIVSGVSGVISTGTLDGQGITGTIVERIQNGLPLNAFVTKRFGGIDKSTGIAIYPDGEALSYVGNPNPKAVLGLSSTLRYKQLTLTVNMNGSFGNKIYNNTLNNVINVGSINNGKNIAVSVLNDPIKESFANPVTASSRFLESGNYMKMTNATLSYTIGNLGKVVKGANVFVTGQNLFVITKFTGFDPEVNVDKNSNGVPSVGIEYIPYPSARTITFGVNFSF